MCALVQTDMNFRCPFSSAFSSLTMLDCITLWIFPNNVEIPSLCSHVIHCTIVTACSKRGRLPPRTGDLFPNDQIIWSTVKRKNKKKRKNGKQYFLHVQTSPLREILKLLNRKDIPNVYIAFNAVVAAADGKSTSGCFALGPFPD